MLKIQENIPLDKLNTFQIGGKAKFFCVVKNTDDLREAIFFAKSRKLAIFVLGGGSNLLISNQGFPGLVIKNEIKGIKFKDLPAKQSFGQVILEVGAGEILDEVITLSVMRNLSGLENLSGIPGTVGGAVVQNAGAYGVELKGVFVSVTGLNLKTGKNFSLGKDDCQFEYRSSYFKKNKKYAITAVTLSLSKKPVFDLDYAGLKNRLINNKNITAQKIRDTILDIRKEKLPDWRAVGTAGSFFKNPIIPEVKYAELKSRFPDLPGFPEPKGKVKVPLAWVLDNICSLKGFKLGPAGLYEKQPLVMINLGRATASDIQNLSTYVKNLVLAKTGLVVEEEVEIV